MQTNSQKTKSKKKTDGETDNWNDPPEDKKTYGQKEKLIERRYDRQTNIERNRRAYRKVKEAQMKRNIGKKYTNRQTQTMCYTVCQSKERPNGSSLNKCGLTQI